MDGAGGTEQFETVIIGGGQAGLSMGYRLARRDRRFVILRRGRQRRRAACARWLRPSRVGFVSVGEPDPREPA